MSSDKLSALAGVVLSLAFSYIPGLKTWFGGLSSTGKRLVMLAVLCEQRGAMEIAWAFVAALVANQATYQLSPASSAKTDG